jgi:aldose sugar dehydrogenase
MLSMLGALLAGAYAYKHRSKIRSFVQTVQPSDFIESSLYLIEVRKRSVPAEGRDGGIAALGDGLVLVSRTGKSWFVDGNGAREAGLRVPVNISDFESDPHNGETVARDRFGVKDILVQTGSFGVRILASHMQWDAENDCYVLRVSSIEGTQRELLSGAPGGGDWKTVFETHPCRALNVLKGGKRSVTLGAGGRLAALSDSEVLVTVGGFGKESEAIESGAAAADEEGTYGKTVSFDVAGAGSRIYTRGHRNPQGLAATSDGQTWLTEHGPKGGDELNLLIEGRDYGWPTVTYGTEYEMMVWPANPRQGRHDGFEKPRFAWVPSIGVSQLLVVQGRAFPDWKGDLLVASLKTMSLYRVRVEDGRTVLVEPMLVGHRIRDVAEIADGSVVLKTEDNFLVYLAPASADAPAGSGPSASRGRILATQCKGCHTFERGGDSGIGPNLWGVAGRRIAANDEFEYSDALRTAARDKGSWTPDALRDFLAAPDSFAPGNSMQMTTQYSESQVADLVAYLESLD